MRAVIQRVKKSSVSVNNEMINEIGPGLLVLLGIAKGDDTGGAEYLADKITNKTGRFRAMMDISLINDGPVTLILESIKSCSAGSYKNLCVK
ncbi:MAG: D-aminoacyl-tRNA deacylase [Desulfobacteraceae bacterium]|nr:D-aminoacyl-tRNA deacylase [Pseudomonadota bacterium]MBU4462880.1 D-aminoacyl-tRNA deacylase [Pseudomonadota bacterium]MCG2755227.1 D-aminoacyl-tRNA deacylase [Desulfobacteraceae bacterium]